VNTRETKALEHFRKTSWAFVKMVTRTERKPKEVPSCFIRRYFMHTAALYAYDLLWEARRSWYNLDKSQDVMGEKVFIFFHVSRKHIEICFAVENHRSCRCAAKNIQTIFIYRMARRNVFQIDHVTFITWNNLRFLCVQFLPYVCISWASERS